MIVGVATVVVISVAVVAVSFGWPVAVMSLAGMIVSGIAGLALLHAGRSMAVNRLAMLKTLNSFIYFYFSLLHIIQSPNKIQVNDFE